MNLYQSVMRRLSTTSWMRWLLSKILNPLDMALRNSRFAPSRFGTNFPLCYLTVAGRKSGEPRTVPLLFVERNGSYIVVGSNFGRDSHPAWVHNCEATDSAFLEIAGKARTVAVRRLSDGEVQGTWQDFDGVWPGYREYRKVAPREIRMFSLTPVDPF